MKIIHYLLCVSFILVTGCASKKDAPYASVEFTQVQIYQECGEFVEANFEPTVYGETDLQNIRILASNLQIAKTALEDNRKIINCYRRQVKDTKKEKKP